MRLMGRERSRRAKGATGGSNWLSWGLLISVLVALGINLQVGTVATDLAEVLGALWNGFTGTGGAAGAERIQAVVWEIRLPRGLTALVVGAGLGTAGACLQGLFRNPLADPGLIGVSSGGAIGAIAAISLQGLWPVALGPLVGWILPLLAMAGASLTTLGVYAIARIAGRTHVSTLLLAGIAVNALAGALVGAVLYISDNDALRRFTFWTLGSLHTATWQQLLVLVVCMLPAAVLLPGFRRALNAFLLGEAEAYHLGFSTQSIKRWVILLCAMMVGSAVAFCGLIGFVGLVVPHMVRLISGPDYRHLLPNSAMAGALLLLLADLLARTVNAPAEIPIGVVTSLIGAPFFLFLIYRRKRDMGF